jgi:hypothetical protein
MRTVRRWGSIPSEISAEQVQQAGTSAHAAVWLAGWWTGSRQQAYGWPRRTESIMCVCYAATDMFAQTGCSSQCCLCLHLMCAHQ